jgi:hypothetical protein
MSTLHHNQPIRIDRAVTHGVAKVRVTHADLTAAALTQTLDWDDLVNASTSGRESSVPANARIMRQWSNLIEEFSGGTVATCVYDVGDDGTADELSSAINVFTGAGTGLKDADGSYTWGGSIEADYNGKIKFTTTVGDVADLDAGEIEFFIQYEVINSDALLS